MARKNQAQKEQEMVTNVHSGAGKSVEDMTPNIKLVLPEDIKQAEEVVVPYAVGDKVKIIASSFNKLVGLRGTVVEIRDTQLVLEAGDDKYLFDLDCITRA